MPHGEHRENPEQGKEQRQPFSLDSWGYTKRELSSFMTRISKGDIRLSRKLRHTLEGGGGKAFGLDVCELISSNFQKDVVLSLTVPSWKVINDIDTYERTKGDYDKIIRSSSPEEDWLDERSGVLESFNFFSDHSSWARFQYFQKNHELPDCPYVIQEGMRGCGMVCDIGYSEILGRVVVKFAYGNRRRPAEFPNAKGAYTSATDDTEAAVGIWDAETGLPLIPSRNFGHESFHPDNIMYRNDFARRLYNAVEKTGIQCGVQLEMVADPDRPNKISLVQVRPSPRRTRHMIENPSSGGRGEWLSQEFVYQSPIVNARFDSSGSPSIISLAKIDANCESGRNYRKGISTRARHSSGSVGIFESMSGLDVSLKYMYAADIFYGAYLNGSDAQITPSSIRPNTWHGIIQIPPEFRDIYAELDEKCGMISLRRDEVKALIEAVKQHPGASIRAVSDGLVGMVGLVK